MAQAQAQGSGKAQTQLTAVSILESLNKMARRIAAGPMKETDPVFTDQIEKWEQAYNSLDDANFEEFVIGIRIQIHKIKI